MKRNGIPFFHRCDGPPSSVGRRLGRKEIIMKKKRNGKRLANATVYFWLISIILLEITIGTMGIGREQALEAQEAEVLLEKKYIEPAIPLENEETESKTSITLTNEDFVDGVATVSFGITLTIDD